MTPLATIPQAPGKLPLIGHAAPLMRDPLSFLQSLPAAGDLVAVQLGRHTAVVVCDPDLTQQVLRNDRIFDKGGLLIERVREVIGDGLASSPRHRHRPTRRLMQPLFQPARLPGYASLINAQIKAMSERWRHGDVLDVSAETQDFTMRVLVHTMFSEQLPAAITSDIINNFATILEGIYRRTILPRWFSRLPTPQNRRYLKASANLRRAILGLIHHRRTSTATRTTDDPRDLLSVLLNPLDTTERPLTETQINDQIVTFFAAGTETGANALSWAMYLLARHPTIQERLHDETAFLTTADAAPLQVPQLPLTSRIVHETLRIMPPVWVTTRHTTTDTHLGGHPIPANTTIMISPYLIHRRDELHPQADLFNPDRWDPDLHAPPPREAFLPFGGGPRKCIGDQFGLLEVTLTLAALTSRWRFELVDDRPVQPTLTIALVPDRLRLRITDRTAT